MRVDVSELRYGLVVESTAAPGDEVKVMLVRLRGVRLGYPQWVGLSLSRDATMGIKPGDLRDLSFDTDHGWRHP